LDIYRLFFCPFVYWPKVEGEVVVECLWFDAKELSMTLITSRMVLFSTEIEVPLKYK